MYISLIQIILSSVDIWSVRTTHGAMTSICFFMGQGYLGIWSGSWGFFKPLYIGLHNQSGDCNAHEIWADKRLEYMAIFIGWTAAYNFNLFGEDFVLSDWNEIELDRNDAYTGSLIRSKWIK